MTASTALFLLIVLACPLLMMLMMRGSHGHDGGHPRGGDDGSFDPGAENDQPPHQT
jgi:hypothetical protein